MLRKSPMGCLGFFCFILFCFPKIDTRMGLNSGSWSCTIKLYKTISLVISSSERKIICYRLLREEQKPNRHYAITHYLPSHLECCMNIQSCYFKKDIEGLERPSEKSKRMKTTRNSFIIRCN